MNDPEKAFSTALRDRVADEHPDFAALTASAIVAGSRLRRRRRLTVAAGAVVAAGAFAAGGVGLAHLLAPPVAVDQSPIPAAGGGTGAGEGSGSSAQTPSPKPLEEGMTISLPSGRTARVIEDASGNLVVVLPDDAPQSDFNWIESTYVPASVGTEGIVAAHAAGPLAPRHPMTVGLDGWTCDEPADDKTTCDGPGGKSVALTWRHKIHHEAYLDPGKSGDVYVSDVRHGIFVTVSPIPDLSTRADADALGESLTWK